MGRRIAAPLQEEKKEAEIDLGHHLSVTLSTTKGFCLQQQSTSTGNFVLRIVDIDPNGLLANISTARHGMQLVAVNGTLVTGWTFKQAAQLDNETAHDAMMDIEFQECATTHMSPCQP